MIIIDALDECAEVDVNGVEVRVVLISTLIKSKAQLLVTSRPLPNIKELFHDVRELEIQPSPQDIRSYVQWRIHDEIHGSLKLRKLVAKYEDLEVEITDVVVEKYSKIFNLARLQMDSIQPLSTLGELRKALQAYPMKEEEFYGQSIQRIKLNKSRSQRALKVLAWIYGARRPMTVEEMLHAVAVMPDHLSMDQLIEFAPEEGDLVDDCEGLIVILSKTRTLAFTHPTVKEYMDIAQQTIFDPCPDVLIARTCLQYLCLDTSGNIQVRNAFERYAAAHWNHHYHRAMAAGLQLDDILKPFIKRYKGKTTNQKVIIAVVGDTGVGKSSFIKLATGADLNIGGGLMRVTNDILAVPCKIGDRDVELLDTPGFDGTTDEVWTLITDWMSHSYKDRLCLSGIIYLRSISNYRITGGSWSQYRRLCELYRANNLSVLLATNLWEHIPQDLGESYEAALIDDMWKNEIGNGSTVARIWTDAEDARRLVKLLLVRILVQTPDQVLSHIHQRTCT